MVLHRRCQALWPDIRLAVFRSRATIFCFGIRVVNRLIQAKIKIGQSGDEYEREADQVAAHALRMPEQGTANPGQTVGD